MLNQDFYKETVNVKKKCHSTTIHLQNMINTIKTHFMSASILYHSPKYSLQLSIQFYK